MIIRYIDFFEVSLMLEKYILRFMHLFLKMASLRFLILFLGDLCATENRGIQPNPKRISNDIWKMIKDHWASIPHKKSHYNYNKTNRKYFDHPDLNVKILYNLFKEYYKEKTGHDVSLKYNTYHKFFRNSSEYLFRSPKTDVCDFCTKCEVKLKVNPDDTCKAAYLDHLKKVQEYKNLKKMYIPDSKKSGDKTAFDEKIYDDHLVLEFDYAQNLTLPKLNINSHYYKRILNQYVFNIHCHNDSDSQMYNFLESDGKKDSNFVSSFLDDFIQRKLI